MALERSHLSTSLYTLSATCFVCCASDFILFDCAIYWYEQYVGILRNTFNATSKRLRCTSLQDTVTLQNVMCNARLQNMMYNVRFGSIEHNVVFICCLIFDAY